MGQPRPKAAQTPSPISAADLEKAIRWILDGGDAHAQTHVLGPNAFRFYLEQTQRVLDGD